jgi:hypothetical protein
MDKLQTPLKNWTFSVTVAAATPCPQMTRYKANGVVKDC